MGTLLVAEGLKRAEGVFVGFFLQSRRDYASKEELFTSFLTLHKALEPFCISDFRVVLFPGW